MLYYGFDEPARHEHMSDEYKDRYIIRTLLKIPPSYYRQCNTTQYTKVLYTLAASRSGWTQTVEVTEETVRSPGVL